METKRVSVDSISSLPDEILAEILSHLPTKRAASTSILSKRWRTLFQFMTLICSSLHLDDSDLLYPDSVVFEDSFRDFVEKTLFSCNKNSLEKFSLKYHLYDDRMGLSTRWISKALERGVSDLDLRVTMPLMHKPPCLVPSTLFVNNTLVKLTLGTELCLGQAPWIVCLPLLKSLFVHTVWFTDSDVCDEFLEGTPQLEELYIDYNYISDTENEFKIQGPPHYLDHDNIKKLTHYLDYNNDVLSPRYLSIYMPSLVYLDYSDYLTCHYDHFESENRFFNALLEARLNLVFPWNGRWGYEHATCLKLLGCITNVQTLYLSSSTVGVMYACLDLDEIPLFNNLATLHFEGNKEEYWKLLCNMIEKSPKLETLVLEGLCGITDSGVNIDGGNVVKVVEIQGYKGRLGELNQVKCFLREMENLEEMRLNLSDETDNTLQQLTNDLLALPKRSSKCKIHVLSSCH